ncbi:hypothetical protein [Paraherbaspirillum soli]|uniref:Uncharacterized protein n=1 Tax=Paraherbaspirillum soli TaxID=631222 RepID=A0ABW0M9P4_9BURK
MIPSPHTRRAICAAIVLTPFAVNAQPATEDPQNPQAVVSSAPYKSVFSDYKSYQDPELQSWRKSNADIGQPNAMTDTSMGNMKGMTEKNMGDMKANSTTAPEKKPTTPSSHAPHSMPHATPSQNGLQKP